MPTMTHDKTAAGQQTDPNPPRYQTMKVFDTALRDLRIAAAMRGERISVLVARLAREELERAQRSAADRPA